MKRNDTPTAKTPPASTRTFGRFPYRKDTVVADVLAMLLDGDELTGMSSVFAQSTTRLAAVVHALRTTYGWTIERRKITVPTNDGRIASIVGYRMSLVTLDACVDIACWHWIAGVKSARACRKAEALKRKAIHSGAQTKVRMENGNH